MPASDLPPSAATPAPAPPDRHRSGRPRSAAADAAILAATREVLVESGWSGLK
ncbi:hypothetical protein GA0115246_112161, partial [Streptomyces sp. SolWspMP-sol7th]